MNPAEWDTCCAPNEMLGFLRESGRSSDRKLRLFACACVREVWQLLADDRSRQAVEVAERYADGSADELELKAARGLAQVAVRETHVTAAFNRDRDIRLEAETRVREATADTVHREAETAAKSAAHRVAQAAAKEAWLPLQETPPGARTWVAGEAARGAMLKAQCDLLRDLFGSPFRALPVVEATWQTPEVRGLAETIYAQRSFGRLSEIAEGLAAAGCADADLLAHLRSPGPHARGCFALDAVLGKS
jgi:hypothetical protein